MSLKETGGYTSYEPLNPAERQRSNEVPVGIKNVGNTCYFNSLLQSFFMIPCLTKEVLAFQVHPSHVLEENKGPEFPRKQASIGLVENLQKLFALMIRSHRKYIDPSNVLHALVDEQGNPIHIGEQKDVGEFNMAFLERVAEGLQSAKPLDQEPKDNTIASLFYGTRHELLIYETEDKKLGTVENKDIFGQIMLDVECKDLYSAWDSAFFSQIEDYAVSDTFKTTAEHEIWLDSLPGVLLFQIQRVKFDKESYKVHKPFHFPQLIYPDRFLMRRKDISSGLRSEMLALKKKINMLESSIEKFENFQGMGIPLNRLLREVHDFLTSQEAQSEMQLEYEDLTLYTPGQLDANTNREVLQSTKDLLMGYAEDSKTKLDDMKGQLAALKDRLDELFNKPELTETAYQLHSILIHDGQAGGGHYYAYIYDAQHQLWRKYNDMHITTVPEEQVMAEAIGGNGACSAYCLLYVEPSLLLSDQILRLYQVVPPQAECNDVYSTYLPPDLLREVDNENVKFAEEIAEYRLTGLMKRVQDMYNPRYTIVTSYFNSKAKGEGKLAYELINFPVFLKTKGFDSLSKWLLLNVCVIENDAEHRSLNAFEEADPVFVKLSTQFKQNCPNAPDSVRLLPAEETKLDQHWEAYVGLMGDAAVDIVAMQMLIQARFLDASKAITYQLSQERPSNEFLFHTRTMNEVLCLRLTSEMVRCVYTDDCANIISIGWLLVMMVTLYIDKNTQLFAILKNRIGYVKDLASQRPGIDEETKETITLMEIGMDSDDFIPPEDLESPLEEIENVKKMVESLDMYLWVEGWKSDAVAALALSLRKEIDDSPIGKWAALNERIKRAHVNNAEFHEIEVSFGIIPN